MTSLKNPIVFTANRLQDGEAVWLGHHGAWVETVEEALTISTPEEKQRAEIITQKADADNHVVEPYPIDITVNNGVPVPRKFREVIRASGPTIRLDLGKQAVQSAHAA